MDWRDLLDERRRRDQQRMASVTTVPVAPPKPVSEGGTEEDGPGFFGGLINKVAAVPKFFGNLGVGIVKDVVQTTGDAIKTGAALGEGAIDWARTHGDEGQAEKATEEAQRLYAAGEISQQEFNDRNAKIQRDRENTARIRENKNLDDIKANPLKYLVSTGETIFNVATLGSGIAAKQAAKAAGKEVVKTLGTETALKLAEETAKKQIVEKAAETAAKRTAGGALKVIGERAAKGAAVGAVYGGLQPLKTEGNKATAEDVFRGALFGAGTGAALPAGASLFDKNIRAGLKEVPGAAAGAAGDVAQNLSLSKAAASHPAVVGFDDQYAQLAQRFDNTTDPVARQQISKAMAENRYQRSITSNAITEGGYIGSGPLDEASAGADRARRQLNGEDIKPLSSVDQATEEAAQAIASEYNSVDDYISKRAREAMNEEASKGVTILPNGSRASEHAPWYRELFGESGRKPSLRSVQDRVRQSLETGSDGGGLVYPEESRIYELLKDRDTAFGQTISEGAPPDLAGQFMDNLGVPGAQAQTPRIKIPGGLPRGPQAGQEALDATMGVPQRFDSPEALQKALGRAESQTNPLIDYVDPLKRAGAGEQTGLPINPADAYKGAQPNYNLPALPTGEIELPSPRQAKNQFARTGEAGDFLNKKPASGEVFELPADSSELGKTAARLTKSGKAKPMRLVSTDEVAALRQIAEDGTGSSFTSTRTPDMNLEEAFKNRGGAQSEGFKVLSNFNTSIRNHTADYTNEVMGRRDLLERFIKEYGVDSKSAQAMRPYLEASTKGQSDKALTAFREQFGDEMANGLQQLRAWWRQEKDVIRQETNEVIKNYANEDRMIGDLGKTYVPRVYKTGTRGFRDIVFDVAHGKMEGLGGEKGLFNLRNDAGYLSKETESMGGGVLRNAEGIPLNSEYATPKTTFLSAAQHRTAQSPIKQLEDPLTSMMRYFEATSRAKHLTPDIAKGQELRQAIELVNNETGNMRQVYKAFEDQVNAIAGKTSNIDRYVVDRAGGNKVVNVANKLQSRVARSTILGSAQSAVAQTGQLPLIAAENGGKNFTGAMQDMFRFIRKTGADPMDESSLMATRYPQYEQMFAVSKSAQAGNKFTKAIAAPFRLIEHASSELAWRSSYRKALEDGYVGREAIDQADRIAAKIIGERSPGARAALYESKALAPVTSYTLEVNQLYQVAKQYFKRDPKRAAKLVGAIWLYNQGYKAVTGNNLNADPLDATLDAGKILFSDKNLDENGQPIGVGERLVRAAGRLGGEAIDATPLGGPVVGELYPEKGFRIPFGGGDRTLARAEVFGDSNFGRYGGGTPIASGLSNPLLLLGIPGMSQLQRSVEGKAAYDQGYSSTPSGRTRFQIEQDPENFWRSLLFGLYNTREGRQYLASQTSNLGAL